MQTDAQPATRSFAPVLAGLSFLWFLELAIVLPSALGLQPLSRVPSACALLGALACAAACARSALRARLEPRASKTPDPSTWTDKLAFGLAALGLCALALCTLAALWFPIVAYDALGYRLPTIAQWLDQGRVAWVDSDDPVRNGYPLGQEVVSAAVAAVSGSLRGAAATSSVFVLLGGLSLVWLARASGVRRSFALAALGVFLLVPMILLNAPSGYVDAAFAGAAVTLFCTAALLEDPGTPPLLAAAALGMAAALTLSLKGTGLPFVLVTGFALGLRALFARRLPSLRALAVASACALPGTFWVLRNIANTGNPLWPVTIQLAGHTVFTGVGSMDYVIDAAHNTPPELASLGGIARVAHAWLQLHGPAQDFDDRLAGLGYAWPLFALPALVAFCLQQARTATRRPELAPIGFVLLACTLCFFAQPMHWWARYVLWLWGAGALALSAQAERLARAGHTRVLGVLGAGCAVFMLLEAANSLAHANGAHLAIRRKRLIALENLGTSHQPHSPHDPRYAQNAASWVAPAFWEQGIERSPDVCRGWWKPDTDDTNLDGVFAQLTPRPRLHILADDDARSWPRVRNRARDLGCSELLLLNGSPVLPSARLDPGVTVEPLVAFDPLFLVRVRNSRTPQP